eukprot:gnl/MRDRNA2_/MRDRNA2_109686_c0_seq1.p1 gnl/MRDRNA2_/MRDRNA2_109686_c0~~gnl/MRDRNA2_/MRDRNA2_109686_c0_seq1.p1  ORF type:complete len:178 (-),score=40.70 gnl/MRDRNA2_/MRDRNA2_109686_c0_seq1:65-598(-)
MPLDHFFADLFGSSHFEASSDLFSQHAHEASVSWSLPALNHSLMKSSFLSSSENPPHEPAQFMSVPGSEFLGKARPTMFGVQTPPRFEDFQSKMMKRLLRDPNAVQAMLKHPLVQKLSNSGEDMNESQVADMLMKDPSGFGSLMKKPAIKGILNDKTMQAGPMSENMSQAQDDLEGE